MAIIGPLNLNNIFEKSDNIIIVFLMAKKLPLKKPPDAFQVGRECKNRSSEFLN
jgi:hypothetical protein